MASHSTKLPASAAHARSITSHRDAHSKHHPSDDEILGLVTTLAHPALTDAAPHAAAPPAGSAAANADPASAPQTSSAESASGAAALAQLLGSHPELRDALAAAQQFRAIFPTPAEALDAKNQLAELDELFFSAHPENHAALAARIHKLSPAAFHGLAHAMQAHSAKIAAAHANAPHANADANPAADSAADWDAPPAHVAASPAAPVVGADVVNRPAYAPSQDSAPAFAGTRLASPAAASAAEHVAAPAASPDPRRAAQLAFFHSTNAAAVQQIISSIESQVNHLLPESVSAGTKTRIVGEIYRDLDSALRSNPQLVRQLREAFHSAFADADFVGAKLASPAAAPAADAHSRVAQAGAKTDLAARQQSAQHSIVTLVTGRAKQALPSIAKRVISEWTHSVVSANRERLARHDSASKRVDISGAGPSDGVSRKPISPREVDYRRLSDSDILNL